MNHRNFVKTSNFAMILISILWYQSCI